MNIKAYPGIPSIMKIVIGTHLVHSYATEHDHVSDNITSKANESSSKTSNSTTVTQDHTSEQNSKCTAVIMSHTQNPYTTPINKDYANDTYAKLKPSDKDIPTGDNRTTDDNTITNAHSNGISGHYTIKVPSPNQSSAFDNLNHPFGSENPNLTGRLITEQRIRHTTTSPPTNTGNQSSPTDGVKTRYSTKRSTAAYTNTDPFNTVSPILSTRMKAKYPPTSHSRTTRNSASSNTMNTLPMNSAITKIESTYRPDQPSSDYGNAPTQSPAPIKLHYLVKLLHHSIANQRRKRRLLLTCLDRVIRLHPMWTTQTIHMQNSNPPTKTYQLETSPVELSSGQGQIFKEGRKSVFRKMKSSTPVDASIIHIDNIGDYRYSIRCCLEVCV
mmetsp:Transcript_30123/g.35793  ORF Transcript_30123/g.35793 Transcript_30123/m.35793 type:complete len:385 (-) Transcript_30123:283-1437(-)